LRINEAGWHAPIQSQLGRIRADLSTIGFFPLCGTAGHGRNTAGRATQIDETGF
jgi:hypothetical protein